MLPVGLQPHDNKDDLFVEEFLLTARVFALGFLVGDRSMPKTN